ncbi:TonB family protein [Haliea sp. E17]|uniref:TonB family protein n=1 Tax=Haliea sp. E17 TaxID=3401576 RepID=UPI003AAC6210
MYLHRKRLACALLALLLLTCPRLLAAQNLQLAGLAVYTDTARDIYIAGLLTPSGNPPGGTSLAPPAAMQYRIATRRISDRGLSGTILLQAEVGAGQRASEAVIDGLETLKQHLKGALQSGDQFEIALSEAGNTVFSLNDVELVTLSGAEVFNYLVQGWIGDSASSLMRDSLLSGKLDDGVQLRYESLIPLEQRRQAIAAWSAGAAAAQPAAQVPAQAPAQPAPEPEVVAAAEPEAEEPAPVAQAAEPAVETVAAAAVVAEASVPEAAPALAAAEPEPQAEPEAELAADTRSEEDVWVDSLDDREYQQQLNQYIASVMTRVFKSVKYPKRAIKREWQGQVEILAQVDSNGRLMDIALEASSGRDLLDEAALDAVKGASPFPELTPVAKAEFLSEKGANSYYMLIPVKFLLN